MIESKTCVRCGKPVVHSAANYETFERMHWLCFHLEFEHHADPDVACGDPSCPWHRNVTSAIPVIAVSDSARAEDYYCGILGFQRMSAHPPDATRPDPRYLAIARDGVWLHLQSYKPERAGMTDAFLWVDDVDRLHEEVSARGAVVQLPPTNQSWGTRETGIRDPDGNVLVFGSRRLK